MYAFSNLAGQFANNRAYSVGANYSMGPFNVGAAWLHNNGRGNTDNGAYEPLALPGSDGTVFDAIVARQNTFGVGASYAFGDFTLAAAFSRSINSGGGQCGNG